MARVTLISYTMPLVGTDPRRLVVLGVKVSSGKLHERDWKHYLTTYPEHDVRQHIVLASKYPTLFEHIVFTFLIEDISRVCSHQLVRHRIASYVQESQRYSEGYVKQVIECLGRYGYKKLEEALNALNGDHSSVVKCLEEGFIFPETIRSNSIASRRYTEQLLKAVYVYRELIEAGIPLEDSRYLLPQAVKTRIMMTVNLRELIHIACLRMRTEAQWEIREVVRQMIKEVKRVVPEIEELVNRMCGNRA